MKRKRKICALIFAAFLVLGGCQRMGDMEQYQAETEGRETALETETETEPGTIFVDVKGAVASPGVYELPLGARVFEAIELAGGLLPEADERAVNEAAKLSDGEQLYIPVPGEAVEYLTESQKDGLVDLNTADVRELTTLPGIGESRAEDIIAYREERGGFSSIEEIKEISGIKDAVFEKIKDKIKI